MSLLKKKFYEECIDALNNFFGYIDKEDGSRPYKEFIKKKKAAMKAVKDLKREVNKQTPNYNIHLNTLSKFFNHIDSVDSKKIDHGGTYEEFMKRKKAAEIVVKRLKKRIYNQICPGKVCGLGKAYGFLHHYFCEKDCPCKKEEQSGVMS